MTRPEWLGLDRLLNIRLRISMHGHDLRAVGLYPVRGAFPRGGKRGHLDGSLLGRDDQDYWVPFVFDIFLPDHGNLIRT